MVKRYRPDMDGTHQGQYKKNKAKIFATQTVCGICGRPVDMSLRYPHPLSKTVDHIIPVSLGGHPSDINNLQLAHWTCNRQKSNTPDTPQQKKGKTEAISNRVLPLLVDWENI